MVATLARASVDGAIIVAAVWLLSRLLHLSPATRTVLWWCAAAKFVLALFWTTPIAIPVLPAAAPARQEVRQRDAGPRQPARVTTTTLPSVSSRSQAAAPPSGPTVASRLAGTLREWSLVAAFAWILGVTLAALVGWRRWRETELMKTSSEPAPDALRSHVADLTARLGIRRTPEVRMSSRIDTPLVAGLSRPVVLLPATRFSGLTEAQQRMALCHELAHVKRADLWLGCVPALAERIFFFHPLAHLAAREYAVAREAACDATVMRTLAASPQEYGRLLLTLGVSQPQAGLTAAGAAWSFVNLKRRMVMLQDVSPQSTRARLVAIAVVALAVAALVPMQLAARPAAPEAATPAASPARAALVAEPRAQAAKPIAVLPADEPVERETPKAGQRHDESVSFVFLPRGDRDVSFASAADTARAKQQRRGDEPLLWFREGGHEYVVRDSGLLEQARERLSEIHRRDGDLRDIDAQDVADIVHSIDIQGIVEQSLEAAHIGEIAADVGVLASQQAMQVLGHVRDAFDIDFDMKHFDMKDFSEKMDKAGRKLDEKMKDFDHKFSRDWEEKMRDVERRVNSLEFSGKGLASLEALGPRMEAFGRDMEVLGRDIEDQVRRSTKDIQKLIDKALADGLAQRVR